MNQPSQIMARAGSLDPLGNAAVIEYKQRAQSVYFRVVHLYTVTLARCTRV